MLNNPALLERVDGHALFANAAAMKAAGITAATKDPSGGRLERAADGSPTGVFVDNAMALMERVVPAPTKQQLRSQIIGAIKEANRWGLTGVHDAGVPRAIIDIYEEIARDGAYDLRNYVMVANSDSAINYYLGRGPQNDLYDGRLWIRSIKIVADGALGSRGAALLEPYADDAKNNGLVTVPAGRVHDVAVRALKAGFQVNVHAIGDRANRTVLNEFEQALKEVPVPDHRFRIEHAQIIHPDDLPRFAELGVIPSMQASHQTSDMYWAVNRIGPTRVLGAYAWRTLLNSGVIPNGSDFPVEQVNPLISFHSAVSRQDANNWPAGGWYAEQRMTREEALKSMTLWPAYAAFMEKESGSLEPGKFADFVILDQDIMQIPAELILKTNVVATYLGGKQVYQRPVQ
ncbi:MAG: amidohydrolase [Gemmatimonadaceae bacterium]